jgi:hypothetical protein
VTGPSESTCRPISNLIDVELGLERRLGLKHY